MDTQVILKSRPYQGEEDLAPLAQLFNLCSDVDKSDDTYAVDDLRLEMSSPEIDASKDMRIWEDEDGRVLAAGRFWRPESDEVVDAFLHWRVHPEVRGTGVESEILAWGEDRLREIACERGGKLPIKLHSGARDFESYNREVLKRHGFQPVRYFFKMARDLSEPTPEPRFPDGYTLRHVESDRDVEQWVECFNQSFIDHFNFHPVRVETHKHWLTSPDYEPERDLIAVAPDGTVAAFCFCWINPADNERNNRKEGWIDILGTRRGHRKIGLGKAMLLSGLLKLKEAGMEKGMLGVDAENPTGALRLYESVGFRKVMTSVSYCKDL